MKFIFDAHLDLSMNALEWNRDLTRPIEEINLREKFLNDKPDRGNATVCLPELKNGNIGLCVATLIARYVKPKNKLPGWNSPCQAWAQTQGQLSWYRAKEEKSEMVQITNISDLNKHLTIWKENKLNSPVGYILSLEGADSILSMEHLEIMYKKGLRAIGPAHYGPGTYAFGTDSDGKIGEKGKRLLKKIEELNLILDVTHLSDISFWESIETFNGPIWASHSNCRSLVPNKRQLSDDQIKVLISKGAIIGMALDAWMMVPNWKRGVTDPTKKRLFLEKIIDHIDHVCQLSGNSNHVGIGSDLDGGFGKEQCPQDINSIADLQKINKLLKKRGYENEDINKILSQNFINFLFNVLK